MNGRRQTSMRAADVDAASIPSAWEQEPNEPPRNLSKHFLVGPACRPTDGTSTLMFFFFSHAGTGAFPPPCRIASPAHATPASPLPGLHCMDATDRPRRGPEFLAASLLTTRIATRQRRYFTSRGGQTSVSASASASAPASMGHVGICTLWAGDVASSWAWGTLLCQPPRRGRGRGCSAR